MPEGVAEGILKGLYKFKAGPEKKALKAHIFGSGPIIREALRAQEILGRTITTCRPMSGAQPVTSSCATTRCGPNAGTCSTRSSRRSKSYVETVLAEEQGVFVAVSDNLKIVPDQIAPWVPGGLTTLGTDGYGRSDTRERLAPLL